MAWMKITLRMRPSEDGEADEEVKEEDEEGGKRDKEDEDGEGGRGIANEADAYDVFEISCGRPSRDTGETNAEDYKYVASQLHQQFGFALTAITLRTSISASDNRWSGLLYDGKRFYQAPTYSVHIVDRVGSGDSFGAALIYACLKGKAPQEIVEFAAAAGCLNHTIEGDFNLVSVSEIEALVSGDRSGRIKR